MRRQAGHLPRLLSQRPPLPARVTEFSVVELPGDLQAASLARQFTKLYCGRHAVDGPTTEVAVLLVSELVTNSVVHGHGAVLLELSSLDDGALHVEVGDADDASPVVGTFTPDRPGGRGLAIVAECARTWGARPSGAGKVVWFELWPSGSARSAASDAPPHAPTELTQASPA